MTLDLNSLLGSSANSPINLSGNFDYDNDRLSGTFSGTGNTSSGNFDLNAQTLQSLFQAIGNNAGGSGSGNTTNITNQLQALLQGVTNNTNITTPSGSGENGSSEGSQPPGGSPSGSGSSPSGSSDSSDIRAQLGALLGNGDINAQSLQGLLEGITNNTNITTSTGSGGNGSSEGSQPPGGSPSGSGSSPSSGPSGGSDPSDIRAQLGALLGNGNIDIQSLQDRLGGNGNIDIQGLQDLLGGSPQTNGGNGGSPTQGGSSPQQPSGGIEINLQDLLGGLQPNGGGSVSVNQNNDLLRNVLTAQLLGQLGGGGNPPTQQQAPTVQAGVSGERPAGQGMLAQMLGPIGGISSRMFGDVPILGDILKVTSPVALDLNQDGEINVTGQSTAKDADRSALGRTVQMDMNGDGNKQNVEWLDGSGDAMLVDNRDGQALADGIDGTRLFGDQGGQFNNGYEKMAQLDSNQDGKLAGAELEGLQAWVDNGDGKATAEELLDLGDLGITDLSTNMNTVNNADGDALMRSSATMNGQPLMTEDVWFAEG